MIGVTTKLTKAGVPVLRLHYSADAKKRPGTVAGNQWLAEATQGYVGGTSSPRWRKEMEIEYGAMQGTSLFPYWEQWCHQSKIICPPFDPHGYRLYGSYDHGYRHPACYLVHGINTEGEIVTLWEAFHSNVTDSEWKRIINGQTVKTRDGRTLPGCPFPRESLAWIVADPWSWDEDKPMSDHTNKSTAWLFLQRPDPVIFTKGARGGDITIAEWLLGEYWADPDAPRWRLTTDCPNLIREIGLHPASSCRSRSPRAPRGRERPTAVNTTSTTRRTSWRAAPAASSSNGRRCMAISTARRVTGSSSGSGSGRDVLLEIDWQGARQVRSVLTNAVGIFIMPPSIEALEARLHKRGQVSPQVISRRLLAAGAEISHAAEFDYVIINENFDQALDKLGAVVAATRLRYPSQAARHRDLFAQLGLT